MTFDEYQEESKKTAIYPNVGNNLIYPTLGLCGEAGEFANTVKKIYRDSDGKIDTETKIKLCNEIGDVCWYVAQLASELGISLNEMAENNLLRLFSRMARNQLHGSGDNR